MARIRTIKPEAWHDEALGLCSRDARLLWTVLITLSDDDGRFRATPSIVHGHGYPYDDEALRLLPGWLDELAKVGLIVLYGTPIAGRAPFGVHPRWHDHQRISKPTPSKYPAPPENAPTSPGRPGPPRETQGGPVPEVDREREVEREKDDDPRAAAPAPAVNPVVGVVVNTLQRDPDWAAALVTSGPRPIEALVDSNADVPWAELAAEAVASKLDTDPNSIRTTSPRQGLELRLNDHRAGRRGGDGAVQHRRHRPAPPKSAGDASRFPAAVA
ncbi:unannotated protein [freshwater metagenome]|uniref:Unannotated protein n=1 Tax=freshwater metagenome TaxID=449393 RepID=A0A6J7GQ00_9ZZZZ|nr:hypothetical protein [Actinomycetota bacterium]